MEDLAAVMYAFDLIWLRAGWFWFDLAPCGMVLGRKKSYLDN
jgi:hypothetical protein